MLHAQKPLPRDYPKVAKTIGDHIKRARLERRLSQEQVAELLSVSRYAISDWEANVVSPTVSLMPKVIEFLGYVPFDDLSEMSEGERIKVCRKLLGLKQKEAAKQLGVCLTTLSSWENGLGIRRKEHWEALEPFIAAACCLRTSRD